MYQDDSESAEVRRIQKCWRLKSNEVMVIIRLSLVSESVNRWSEHKIERLSGVEMEGSLYRLTYRLDGTDIKYRRRADGHHGESVHACMYGCHRSVMF